SHERHRTAAGRRSASKAAGPFLGFTAPDALVRLSLPVVALVPVSFAPASTRPRASRGTCGRVSPPNVAALTSFPKDRIKVLLLENIHPSAHEIFRSETFHLETLPGSLSEDELVARIEDVHVIGIRSKTKITDRVLASARRLLTVGCFCIGTNQVDLASAN